VWETTTSHSSTGAEKGGIFCGQHSWSPFLLLPRPAERSEVAAKIGIQETVEVIIAVVTRLFHSENDDDSRDMIIVGRKCKEPSSFIICFSKIMHRLVLAVRLVVVEL
jgi:hypothetical protein